MKTRITSCRSLYTERIPATNGCPRCNNNTELTSFPINPTNRLPLIIV